MGSVWYRTGLLFWVSAAILGCGGNEPAVLSCQDDACQGLDLSQSDIVPETSEDQGPSGPMLSGVVVVEGEEGIAWPVSVTAVAGDLVLTETVDSQGAYRFEGIPQGSYTVTASGGNCYPALAAVDVGSEGTTLAPELVLRRWRLLLPATDLWLGQPQLDGAVFPYGVNLSSNHDTGELWLYLVETDQNIQLAAEASTRVDITRGLEGSSLLIFATEESKLNHIATVHIYDVAKQIELAVVPHVLTDQLPRALWGEGVLLSASPTDQWGPPADQERVWVDGSTGEIHHFWQELWFQGPPFWLGRRICSGVGSALSQVPSDLICWNTETRQAETLQTEVCSIWDIEGADADIAGILILAGSEGQCESVRASFMDADGTEVLPVDPEFNWGETLPSPDKEAVATVSGCGLFPEDYQPCIGTLNVIRLAGQADVVTVADGVLRYSTQWSADSRYLVFLRQGPDGNLELTRYDRVVEDLVVLSGTKDVGSFQLDPTSRRAVFWVWPEEGATPVELWLADLEDGAARQLSTQAAQGEFEFSPDGENLAWEYFAQVITEYGVMAERNLALASLETPGLLPTELGCKTAHSAHSCRWSKDSVQALCLCENTDYAITDGGLTLFDLASGEQLPLCSKGPHPWAWVGPQHTWLVQSQSESGQWEVRWWDASDGLAQDPSALVTSCPTGPSVSYHEGDLLAIVFASWTPVCEANSLVLDMRNGASSVYPEGLSFGAAGAYGWEYHATGDMVNPGTALLVNRARGEVIELANPPVSFGVASGFKGVVWRKEAATLPDLVESGLSGFDAESGQTWDISMDPQGAIVLSEDGGWLAAGESQDPLLSTPSKWWGTQVKPGQQPVYLAGNVLLSPTLLAAGAMVYGCASTPDGGQDGVCVARMVQ